MFQRFVNSIWLLRWARTVERLTGNSMQNSSVDSAVGHIVSSHHWYANIEQNHRLNIPRRRLTRKSIRKHFFAPLLVDVDTIHAEMMEYISVSQCAEYRLECQITYLRELPTFMCTTFTRNNARANARRRRKKTPIQKQKPSPGTHCYIADFTCTYYKNR